MRWRDAEEHAMKNNSHKPQARFRRWLGNLGVLLALAAGLAAWVMLPWPGVLAIAVLLALWLLFTRGGRLALAAARIGIASLPQRWGASSVIVVGIAGVVGVLVAMLAMGEGFKATLDQTGSDDTAIILRGGSQAETNSVIAREQIPLISSLPGIARGGDGQAAISRARPATAAYMVLSAPNTAPIAMIVPITVPRIVISLFRPSDCLA
jgi:putative ABC transport system permease protein